VHQSQTSPSIFSRAFLNKILLTLCITPGRVRVRLDGNNLEIDVKPVNLQRQTLYKTDNGSAALQHAFALFSRLFSRLF